LLPKLEEYLRERKFSNVISTANDWLGAEKLLWYNGIYVLLL